MTRSTRVLETASIRRGGFFVSGVNRGLRTRPPVDEEGEEVGRADAGRKKAVECAERGNVQISMR